MSEWDFEEYSTEKQDSNSFQSGKWDAALTIAALLSVTAVSFLTAWITQGIPSRPFWMLGLCFAAPVAALMLSVFLKEKASSAMTPSTSRKAQLMLVLCSILAAAVVGCFCQVTNEKADTYEEVVTGEGWSDLLIILDKSGSMSWTAESLEALESGKDREEALKLIKPGDESLDETASKAVTDLIGELDDKTQAGMLIDVGWKENNEGKWVTALEKRKVPILPLTSEHRQKLIQMANTELGYNENFVRAFEVACDMIEEHGGENGTISILFISDGLDSTHKFRASMFADRLQGKGVKVNYLYITSEPVEEMQKLTEITGGSSIYVNQRQKLLEQMKKMAKVPVFSTVYKDALRDLDESFTAKTVTGILLLLLGVLIGISLTAMLSVHGQKRIQVFLSPLMAVCAFAVLVYGKTVIAESWVREGIAFSLLGIVLMKANRTGRMPKSTGKPALKGEGDGLNNTAEEW